MEQLEEMKHVRIAGTCAMCGFESKLYPFKDTFICKACYYQT